MSTFADGAGRTNPTSWESLHELAEEALSLAEALAEEQRGTDLYYVACRRVQAMRDAIAQSQWPDAPKRPAPPVDPMLILEFVGGPSDGDHAEVPRIRDGVPFNRLAWRHHVYESREPIKPDALYATLHYRQMNFRREDVEA